MKYRLTPAARGYLLDILEYLGRESPSAAWRVYDKLREAMRQLAARLGMGHLREDLADEPLRLWSVYSFLIVHRPKPRPIQIVRVLHGSRDIRSILDRS